MNERIRELIQQATSYTWNGNDVTEELDEQKFAELIVAECLDILDDEDDGELTGRSVRIAAIRIKQLFGVEE